MTLANTTANMERPTYPLSKAIEVVKDAVTVEAYAADLTELRQVGRSLRGWCPVHAGSNPQSFAVYPNERRWHCFRCNRGGDVIDLCQAIEGGEVREAMLTLARRFNVELPQRPPQWGPWQDQKGKIRTAVKRDIAVIYQRRLTRIFASLVGDGREDLEELATSLWPISLDMAERRVRGE